MGEVTHVEALLAAMNANHREQMEALKALTAAIRAQTDAIAHVDSNVSAVGYQVTANGKS